MGGGGVCELSILELERWGGVRLFYIELGGGPFSNFMEESRNWSNRERERETGRKRGRERE